MQRLVVPSRVLCKGKNGCQNLKKDKENKLEKKLNSKGDSLKSFPLLNSLDNEGYETNSIRTYPSQQLAKRKKRGPIESLNKDTFLSVLRWCCTK